MEHCEQCGYGPVAMAKSAENRLHAKYHSYWVYGIPLPPGIKPPENGLLVIPANEPSLSDSGCSKDG